MPVITDSSFLYALYNKHDSNHIAAQNSASQYHGGTIVPDVTLPEVTYLLKRDLGYDGFRGFIANFKKLGIPLEPLSVNDLMRVDDISGTYRDAEFDFVDCCLMAMSERLEIEEIATFDRRDFSIFRPRHCDYLTLCP